MTINENHETLAKEDVDFQEMDYSYPIRQNLLTAGHSYLIRVVDSELCHLTTSRNNKTAILCIGNEARANILWNCIHIYLLTFKPSILLLLLWYNMYGIGQHHQTFSKKSQLRRLKDQAFRVKWKNGIYGYRSHNFNIEPSIGASRQVSVHLAKQFQRRRFLEINQPETRIAYSSHVC
jgi:hypothetical protein